MDSITITFRPATLEDARLLLSWRNDPITRAMSHTMDLVPLEQHVDWLTKSLVNQERKLIIAELDGVPAGTCRADFEPDATIISCTVAPWARGKGVGTQMVKYLASISDKPIRAEIKASNPASIRMCEAGGMRCVGKNGDLLTYARTF